MYISINKQLIQLQNCFGILSRPCQGKGQKNFSHFECLRGQHVPRELQVDRACCRGMFYLKRMLHVLWWHVHLCRILLCTTQSRITTFNVISVNPTVSASVCHGPNLIPPAPNFFQEIWPWVAYCTNIHIQFLNSTNNAQYVLFYFNNIYCY